MKTYWTTATELAGMDCTDPLAGFTRLGVADSVEGAVESLRHFIADNSGTMPVPMASPEIAAEVKGHAVYLTVLDSDFPR